MSIPLDQLIAGELPYILIGRDDLPNQSIVLPGSFNPLHKGHEGLLRAARKNNGEGRALRTIRHQCG